MRSGPTFDQFFSEIYLPRARARKRSWPLDERLERKHVSPVLGNMKLKDISRLDVENWFLRFRAGGLAPSSCNRILAVLKSAFALAESLNIINQGQSPAREIRNLRIFNHHERYLSRTEGRRLNGHLARIDGQQARIIQLLLLTGARKSEILRARWENLDCERRILTVPVSKSGRTKYIYLSRTPQIFSGKSGGKATAHGSFLAAIQKSQYRMFTDFGTGSEMKWACRKYASTICAIPLPVI